jgi:phenylacetic acid degradation operon negative regulatory protein
VFDLYGDYVRYRGGEIALRALAGCLAPFGVSADSVRVTVSRMSREGWLAARRLGRCSYYSLTARSWQLLDEGRPRIFQRGARPWDGQWCLLLYSVPEAERAVRERLRKALAWLGFGPLAPSTWLSPYDQTARLDALLAEQGLAERAHVFFARSRSAAEDRALVQRCWDLAALDHRYASFLATYAPRLSAYQAGALPDEQCFVERVRLVDGYRRFPFLDPDLPAPLLLPAWRGQAAHEVFVAAYEALRAPAFRYFDAHLAGWAHPEKE